MTRVFSRGCGSGLAWVAILATTPVLGACQWILGVDFDDDYRARVPRDGAAAEDSTTLSDAEGGADGPPDAFDGETGMDSRSDVLDAEAGTDGPSDVSDADSAVPPDVLDAEGGADSPPDVLDADSGAPTGPVEWDNTERHSLRRDQPLMVTSGDAGSWNSIRARRGISKGKVYWEVSATSSSRMTVGVMHADAGLDGFVGADDHGWSYRGDGMGFPVRDAGADAIPTEDHGIVGVALDMDQYTVSFQKYDSELGSCTSTGVSFSGLTGEVFPAVGLRGGDPVVRAVGAFRDRSLACDPPPGFVALDSTTTSTNWDYGRSARIFLDRGANPPKASYGQEGDTLGGEWRTALANRVLRGSGKFYWEIVLEEDRKPNFELMTVGITRPNFAFADLGRPGDDSTSWGYNKDGALLNGGAPELGYGAGFAVRDVVGVGLDLDAGTLRFYLGVFGDGGVRCDGLVSVQSVTNLKGSYVPAVGIEGSSTHYGNFSSSSIVCKNRLKSNGGEYSALDDP